MDDEGMILTFPAKAKSKRYATGRGAALSKLGRQMRQLNDAIKTLRAVRRDIKIAYDDELARLER